MRSLITMVASLDLLAGCAGARVSVPPQALPALAESQVVVYETEIDGARLLERGRIRGVSVQARASASSRDSPHRVSSRGTYLYQDATEVERFRAPFTAKLSGEQLELANEDRRYRLALRDIRQIEVLYDRRVGSREMGMQIAGIVLTSLGGASLVTGVALWGPAGHSSGGAAFLVVVPPLVLGTVLAGVGIPLWAAGASPGKLNQAGLPATVPTLVPTRNGAALRWAF
jgi:hypothetical protein